MNYRLFVKENLEAISSEELERALASLPEWRREKALRFKHRQGRIECAFSYLLLCQALREVYGITEHPSFLIGEHGKPELKFNDNVNDNLNLKPQTSNLKPICFNISHCKSALAVALSTSPVGIDVECIGRYSESLARHVLNDNEFAEVSQSPNPQIPFTRLWTQKEAVVKLTGRGIDDDLPNLLLKYNNVSLHTEEHLAQGYILSVATFLD
ncbi:MAG: 4'-phosphopantetheinyl transferase superfamily protein [Bacteroidaceae bacterium]|nr:4'-phosphopantetheinyl transferase superfamily protein [Bacteroidaceae bacterium]